MNIEYEKAKKEDFEKCIDIRGLTNDNQFNRDELAAIGVTTESWSPMIENGDFIGYVALEKGVIIGFCFGDIDSGEVLVLAVLAGYEGAGIGRKLLTLISDALFATGNLELWLAASATPIVNAYGFYRNVGWLPTGELDENGDEILRMPKHIVK